MTYDTATHKVTVKVDDNGAGQLVATVTDNNPTFTNTYVASSTKVPFTAKKVLKGDKELVKVNLSLNLKKVTKSLRQLQTLQTVLLLSQQLSTKKQVSTLTLLLK